MKNGSRRLLGLLLTMILAVSLVPGTVFAATVVDSGYCGGERDGTNLSWTLDSDGVLTISGTGRMLDGEEGQTKSGSIVGIPWIDRREDIQSVTVLEGVTYIGDYAFSCLPNLEQVNLSEGIQEIGDLAFNGDTSLPNITLPNSVTTMGRAVFGYCSILSDVHLSENLSTISDATFYESPSLDHLIIPSKVTTIERDAFWNCTGLTEVELSDNLQSIGNGAFQLCYNLSKIEFPDGLVSIGNNAFKQCSNLSSIVLPDSVKEIGKYAFSGCHACKTIVLPSGLSEIGHGAFEGCSANKIKIPESVTYIGQDALACMNLSSVKLPDTIEIIGNGAFGQDARNDTGIPRIMIPASVKKIGTHQFSTGNMDVYFTRDVYFRGDAPEVSYINSDAEDPGITNLKPFDRFYTDLITLHCIKGTKGWTEEPWTDYQIVWHDPDTVFFVYFDTLGDTPDPACIVVNQGDSYGELPKPVKKHDSFLGWFTSPVGGEEINAETIVNLMEDQILYAHWISGSTYTVSFNANGGTGTTPKATVIKGQPFTLPPNGFKAPSGQQFKAWKIGTKQYHPGAKYIFTNNTIVTALWEDIPGHKDAYNIGPLTILDPSGAPLTAIPAGPFQVTVPVTKQLADSNALVFVAAYTADGQYKGLMYVALKNATEGATVEVTLPVENPSKDISTLKAFAVPSFQDMTPLGPASVFPAA